MYLRARTTWVKHLDFYILDIVCLNAAFVLAYAIRFPGQGAAYQNLQARSIIIVMSLLEIVASAFMGNLGNVLKRGNLVELGKVMLLAFVTLAAISLYLFSVHRAEEYSRLLIYYTAALFFVIDYAGRVILKAYLVHRNKRRSQSKFARSLLILTDSANAETIINEIKNDKVDIFNIRGIALTDGAAIACGTDIDIKEISGVPVVADEKSAPDFICREWVDEVLIYLPDSTKQPKDFISACKEMGVTIHSVMNLSSVEKNKQFIERIGNRTVLTTAYNYIVPHQAIIKRMLDIAGGIVGSILAILIIIIVGPIIYFKSPGPIIFKQKRIGRNGKPFTVYKLRSMYLDAEERKKEFAAQNRVSDGMMFKLDFDPRIIGNEVLPDGTKKTGIGEFIRKTSLDEFPQFFNVLKSDMSLVGIRPPTVDEWEKYENHHRARVAMRPGITGM